MRETERDAENESFRKEKVAKVTGIERGGGDHGGKD